MPHPIEERGIKGLLRKEIALRKKHGIHPSVKAGAHKTKSKFWSGIARGMGVYDARTDRFALKKTRPAETAKGTLAAIKGPSGKKAGYVTGTQHGEVFLRRGEEVRPHSLSPDAQAKSDRPAGAKRVKMRVKRKPISKTTISGNGGAKLHLSHTEYEGVRKDEVTKKLIAKTAAGMIEKSRKGTEPAQGSHKATSVWIGRRAKRLMDKLEARKNKGTLKANEGKTTGSDIDATANRVGTAIGSWLKKRVETGRGTGQRRAKPGEKGYIRGSMGSEDIPAEEKSSVRAGKIFNRLLQRHVPTVKAGTMSFAQARKFYMTKGGEVTKKYGKGFGRGFEKSTGVPPESTEGAANDSTEYEGLSLVEQRELIRKIGRFAKKMGGKVVRGVGHVLGAPGRWRNRPPKEVPPRSEAGKKLDAMLKDQGRRMRIKKYGHDPQEDLTQTEVKPNGTPHASEEGAGSRLRIRQMPPRKPPKTPPQTSHTEYEGPSLSEDSPETPAPTPEEIKRMRAEIDKEKLEKLRRESQRDTSRRLLKAEKKGKGRAPKTAHKVLVRRGGQDIEQQEDWTKYEGPSLSEADFASALEKLNKTNPALARHRVRTEPYPTGLSRGKEKHKGETPYTAKEKAEIKAAIKYYRENPVAVGDRMESRSKRKFPVRTSTEYEGPSLSENEEEKIDVPHYHIDSMKRLKRMRKHLKRKAKAAKRGAKKASGGRRSGEIIEISRSSEEEREKEEEAERLRKERAYKYLTTVRSRA